MVEEMITEMMNKNKSGVQKGFETDEYKEKGSDSVWRCLWMMGPEKEWKRRPRIGNFGFELLTVDLDFEGKGIPVGVVFVRLFVRWLLPGDLHGTFHICPD